MNASPDQLADFCAHPRVERVPTERLELGVATLARGLGYRSAGTGSTGLAVVDHGREMPTHMEELARAMLAVGRELIDPQCVWVPTQVIADRECDTLIAQPPHSGTLSVGNLVCAQLRGACAVAVFVVTIGDQLERRARSMMDEGRSLEGYVLDTVGSMAVEAAADVLESEVAAAAKPLGWRITNRFSPGYCTWLTADQQALFALLPSEPAGVRLSDSSLMAPIKSISGVIGLGETVEHRPYMCDMCSMTTCHQRLTSARL